MMDAPRALALIGDETACSLWRVWQPFAELERHGFIAEWCHKDDAAKVLPLVASGRYNVMVTPRIIWPHEGAGEKWISTIRKAGLAWIYELDDDALTPRIVDRQSRLFQSERDKGEEQLEWERKERIRLLGMADGITVSTQRLASVVRAYVGDDVPIYHVPNAIDVRWFRETLRGCGRIPELEGKLTIGWAGGSREDVDLAQMAEAWSVIAERYPNVQFVVQGHITSALADAVPQHRRHTLPWLELSEYPRALLNIDIACASVAPTVFNGSKSAIKWFEYTLAGAVCVVSPTVYGREVEHDVSGLVARTTEEWVEHLSALVESAALRRRLYREARRVVVTQHSLEANWYRWPDAYADAVERFTASQRVPQLVLQ